MTREAIPVSVLVVTKNEADKLERCLEALKDFQDIVVIDSGSDDGTADIARRLGARVVDFTWNGRYPKKRQWCLDTLDLASERVFFVDADEVVTPELVEEIRTLDWRAVGYFVRGRYVWQGHVLQYGLKNNKLALFDRRKVEFPVVDDLDAEGMGEIEGHYQPILKEGFGNENIGQLSNELLHYACEKKEVWQGRHERYARWEVYMNERGSWPEDVGLYRKVLKLIFRNAPFRPYLAFLHSYIVKVGFLDGAAGYDFARSRAAYYRMISAAVSNTG